MKTEATSALRIVLITLGLIGVFLSWNSGFMIGVIFGLVIIFGAMLAK